MPAHAHDTGLLPHGDNPAETRRVVLVLYDPFKSVNRFPHLSAGYAVNSDDAIKTLSRKNSAREASIIGPSGRSAVRNNATLGKLPSPCFQIIAVFDPIDKRILAPERDLEISVRLLDTFKVRTCHLNKRLSSGGIWIQSQ